MGEPDRIWGSSYWELLKVAQQCGIFGSGVSHGPDNDGSGMILVPATLHEESCVWQSNEQCSRHQELWLLELGLPQDSYAEGVDSGCMRGLLDSPPVPAIAIATLCSRYKTWLSQVAGSSAIKALICCAMQAFRTRQAALKHAVERPVINSEQKTNAGHAMSASDQADQGCCPERWSASKRKQHRAQAHPPWIQIMNRCRDIGTQAFGCLGNGENCEAR